MIYSKNIKPELCIKEKLLTALEALDPIDACAHMGYNGGQNIGSHLLWLCQLMYFSDYHNPKVLFASSFSRIDTDAMASKIGNAPIILGGGYIGDYWSQLYQSTHGKWGYADRNIRLNAFTKIISRFKKNPIVIMPQSISIRNPELLKQTAKIFNDHPALTVFVRDEFSFDRAKTDFYKCDVLKAPDIVFYLAGHQSLLLRKKHTSSVLYLERTDWELDDQIIKAVTNLPFLVHKEPWRAFQWLLNKKKGQLKIQGVASMIKEILQRRLPNRADFKREMWQRRFSNPEEWISRVKWTSRFKQSLGVINNLDSSWYTLPIEMLHTGLYQMQQHSMIITNRLHGHILSVLLNIPHILLPGPYQKMEFFYKAWTRAIPFCRYVNKPEQLLPAIKELQERYTEYQLE